MAMVSMALAVGVVVRAGCAIDNNNNDDSCLSDSASYTNYCCQGSCTKGYDACWRCPTTRSQDSVNYGGKHCFSRSSCRHVNDDDTTTQKTTTRTTPAAAEYQTANWDAGRSLPDARSGFGTAYIPAQFDGDSQLIMVAGGSIKNRTSDKELLDSVFMYSVDAATWSETTTMPETNHYFGVAYIPAHDGVGRGQVMVAGGHNGIRVVESAFLYSVDAATWRETTAMPIQLYSFGMVYLPAHDGVGGGQVMVAAGDSGYGNGGERGGRYSNAVFMYSVDAATWSKSTAMPVRNHYFSMVYLPPRDGGGGGDVMAVGGHNGRRVLDSVFIYSVDADSWSTSTPMPGLNFACGIAQIPAQDGGGRGHVLIAGGGDGEKLIDAMYVYDVDEATWIVSGSAPVVANLLSIVHIPARDGAGRGQLMLAGGHDGDSDLDSVFMLSVDEATWSESTAMPVANHNFGMACAPAQDGGGTGKVMVATRGRGVGGKVLDPVYMYSVDQGRWSESAAVASDTVGMAYIPAQDGGGTGKVMVAGGKYLESVYIYSVEAATWSESAAMPVANN